MNFLHKSHIKRLRETKLCSSCSNLHDFCFETNWKSWLSTGVSNICWTNPSLKKKPFRNNRSLIIIYSHCNIELQSKISTLSKQTAASISLTNTLKTSYSNICPKNYSKYSERWRENYIYFWIFSITQHFLPFEFLNASVVQNILYSLAHVKHNNIILWWNTQNKKKPK